MSTFENRGSYLFVKLSAPYSFHGVISVIQQIADVCKTDDLNKVLVDARAFAEEISVFDRFQMGVEIARLLGAQIQMAVTVRPILTVNPVTENAAINRGTKYKWFLTFEDAEQWLLGKKDEPLHITKR